MADVVLPGSTYTEKYGTYVNTEGRAQESRVAVSAPGEAKEDWKIIRALSEVCAVHLPYDSLLELRDRMWEIAPNLTQYDVCEEANFSKEANDLGKVTDRSGRSAGNVCLSFSW